MVKALDTVSHLGRYGGIQKVFAFRLDSVYIAFDVFKTNENYSTLLQNIHVGDTITVYSGTSRTGLYFDALQIEKKGQILLDYKSFRYWHLALAIFFLLCSLAFLANAFWFAFKGRV